MYSLPPERCEICEARDQGIEERWFLVGLGSYICGQCRRQLDAAYRQGLWSFADLLELVGLRACGSVTGNPVAVSTVPAPFGHMYKRSTG